MKLSFLCCSFEAGRDGVGDYVRRFAAALTSDGHQIQVIALADRYVDTPMIDSGGGTGTEVIRLPAAQWARSDIAAAETALTRFSPDWLSLQMVCYGYEPRGLLIRSGHRFARLKTSARRHLMLHELWIGQSASAGLADRMVGWLQKQLLLKAIRRWNPAVTHTSNSVYRALLGRHGIAASELPLPGNIPVHSVAFAIARQKLSVDCRLEALPDNVAFMAGVFGSIHPEWADPRPLLRLSQLCRQAGRCLILVQIGRAGDRGIAIWRSLRARLSSQIIFADLGELAVGDLSIALQGLDLGIATSPWQLIAKSGAVATMLDHGLPVLVTRDDYQARGSTEFGNHAHPRLFKLDDDFMHRLQSGMLGREMPSNQSGIYRTFAEELRDTLDSQYEVNSPC